MSHISSAGYSSDNKAYPLLNLQPMHQKVLQIVLAIVVLTGIILGVLSYTGYLSHLVSYVIIPVSIVALTALILISCASKSKLLPRQTHLQKHKNLETQKQSAGSPQQPAVLTKPSGLATKKPAVLPRKPAVSAKLPSAAAKQPEEVPQKPEIPKIYPVVSNHLKEGFFVDVINSAGYWINGKLVTIPPAEKPVKFTRLENIGFEQHLDILRNQSNIQVQKPVKIQFKDLTTEQAINESTAFRIALNFANEHHAGGGPGFHRDSGSNLFIYDSPSAKAQEESICQRSDLMASLTQLPHTLRADVPGSSFIRSYYNELFNSRNMAYVSLNRLFAVQAGHNFYSSRYLEEPKSVAFVTSAAAQYGGHNMLDCSKNSAAYKDAEQRIDTHLLAAASRAAMIKQNNPNQETELILGAFGCGAFAPTGNPDEYRQMIATIYKERISKLRGFFDVITFAVPSFSNPADANHNIFKNVLGF